MLQKLNERVKGVVAWIVIIMIATTFALFGVDYYVQSRHAADIEAKVNGDVITKEAFELQYRRQRQMTDPAVLRTETEKTLKENVLNDMITNLIAQQSATHLGFSVFPEQANAAILAIPQFQEEGRFSAERYQQALSAAMYTPETFQTQVRHGMLLNQQRFAFMGTAFALPEEIERFVKLYMQTRDYDVLTIPAESFNQQNIPKSEIQQYYTAHQNEFIEPEKVQLEWLALSLSDIKKKIQIDEKQVKDYYNNNKNNFIAPAQWKIANILFKVPADASKETQDAILQTAQSIYQKLEQDPKQFDAFVKTHSQDRLSAKNAGELPWITAGTTSYDEALLELKTPGQISKPFKTQQGYEIFKLAAYKPAQLQAFDQVKQQIADEMKNDQVQTKYASMLEKLSELSYQVPDNLNEAAQALQLPLQKTGYISKTGGHTRLTRNNKVLSAAFSPDVLNLRNNSEPIQLDDNTVVVIRVIDYKKATQKTFAEVKDSIVKTLTKNKAARAASAFGQALLGYQYQNNTQVLQQRLQQAHLTWQNYKNVPRETNNVNAEAAQINELAFTLSRPEQWQGLSLVNGDYIIVKLVAVHDGKFSSLDKELQASITQQVEANYGIMDYNLYMKALRNAASVKKD